ncbi:hypothetical protein FO519_002203 [Halicephalobus sp. NKZ332]|nr:hypothetical protein FO519_002203 [Halicephalobus sp. NKZ332]
MRKLSRITIITLFGVLFFQETFLLEIQSCSQIDETFSNTTNSGDTIACHCYQEQLVMSKTDTFENDNIWIGCTKQTLPAVFRTLNSLNETFLSKLMIWNSLINILPTDMFAKVRPRELTIESSMLSVFRPGSFDKIGQRLKKLNLRSNIIKSVDPNLFKEITAVEELDLSKNKISNLTKEIFSPLSELRVLLLDGNQISNIDNGIFESLSNLKTLNLANNKIRQIRKDAFKGLVSLEVLNLVGNQITTVDWSAFSHMKRLRVLNFGKNGLSKVELRGLESLQQFYLNNNQIESLKDVKLRDLPSLTFLSFDRNGITSIGHEDLSGLGQSTRLNSISFATNMIEDIDNSSFEPVHWITSLSLQGNALSSLSSKVDATPYLRPLRKLRNLYISGNKIQSINDEELTSLEELEELVLDHNRIEQVSKEAFRGLKLKKIFLNSNSLFFLPEGIFDDLNIEELEMIDLSGNSWECVCGKEWLGPWLNSIGQANTPKGNLGCLEYNCTDIDQDHYHPLWVTGVAFCLTLVTVCCMVAIGYLLLQEGRRHWPGKKPLASDKERLIPGNLSFPNPVNLSEPDPSERLPDRTTPKKENPDRKHVRFG